MSEIRVYLEAKAALPEREWLRREPRGTHPAILAAVREALVSIPASRGGTVYDDDVERFVNDRAGDLPPHTRHGTEGRDRLVSQLGHEVYVAKVMLDDERASAKIAEAEAAGYAPPSPLPSAFGGRFMLRRGTLYSGRSVPEFGPAEPVRLERHPEGWGYIPKGKRTSYRLPDHALVREGWEAMPV